MYSRLQCLFAYKSLISELIKKYQNIIETYCTHTGKLNILIKMSEKITKCQIFQILSLKDFDD